MREKEFMLQAQYKAEMEAQKRAAQQDKDTLMADLKLKMSENERKLREAQDAELKLQMEQNAKIKDEEMTKLMTRDEEIKKDFEKHQEEMKRKLMEKDEQLKKLALEQEQARMRQIELEKARIRQEEDARRKQEELEREWDRQRQKAVRKQKELEQLAHLTNAELAKQRAKAEEKQRELERQQEEAQKARKDLEYQREEARRKNEELEAERAAARQRDETLERQRVEAMELQQKLEREKEESKRLQEKLEADSKMTKGELAAFRKEALDKQRELEKQQEKALQIQAELAKKHEEARRNRELLDQKTQEAAKNRQLLEAQKAEAEAKQKQLEKEKAENLRREQEIKKLQTKKPTPSPKVQESSEEAEDFKKMSQSVQKTVIREVKTRTASVDSTGGENMSTVDDGLSGREMHFRDSHKRRVPRKKRADSFQATDSRADSNLRQEALKERMKKIEVQKKARHFESSKSEGALLRGANRNTPRDPGRAQPPFATYSFTNRTKRSDSRSMALSGRLETKNIKDNYIARKPIQSKVRSPKVRREIPLVELEYLNLTAAAIYMKYNKKGDPYNQLNLTSQELIQASQNLPFYNIYDFMCDYVESRRRRFEEQALSLEMSANPVFKNGQEVVWQEATGDTITGEIIDVFRENGTGALTLRVSDGRRKRKARASEVSIVPRRHGGRRKPKNWLWGIFKGKQR